MPRIRRRDWLASGLLAVAGCGRNSDPSRVRRDRHRAAVERVPGRFTLSTPAVPIDLAAAHPEFKSLTKIAHRLHPRFGDEPGPRDSKLGGQFFWPDDEPLPKGMHPVLQLRLDDAPPQCPFLPGTDLMQLLWTADDKPLKAIVAWRKESDVTGSLATMPSTATANLDRVPVPCRLFPERVVEWPSLGVLPLHGRDKLQSIAGYDETLSAATGTKIGGYGHRLTAEQIPACSTCRRGMDFLLTVDSLEWTNDRWRPVEERDDRHVGDAGLSFGDATACHVFVCRRCQEWPIAVRVV
jgi:hypothetical protein